MGEMAGSLGDGLVGADLIVARPIPIVPRRV